MLQHVKPLHLIEAKLARLERLQRTREALDAGLPRLFGFVLAGLDAKRTNAAALLHQAQAAWRAGQSAQALALANQHAQQFPRSQLANERDVLRVLSMCKLGQAQSAKQVGARLLKKAKGSPWYQSVAASCAGD